MISQETIKGNWHEVKGKIRSRWGQLTDDQLEQTHGNIEQLIGTIQQKTGATHEQIEAYFDEIGGGAASMLESASESIHEYADAAAEQFRAQSEMVGGAVREGYEQTEAFIKKKPMETLATCFGVGVVTGVVVGLLLRSR